MRDCPKCGSRHSVRVVAWRLVESGSAAEHSFKADFDTALYGTRPFWGSRPSTELETILEKDDDWVLVNREVYETTYRCRTCSHTWSLRTESR